MELHDPTIPLLKIKPKELKQDLKETLAPSSSWQALFTIAKI